jgi:hypothetical protein
VWWRLRGVLAAEEQKQGIELAAGGLVTIGLGMLFMGLVVIALMVLGGVIGAALSRRPTRRAQAA